MSKVYLLFSCILLAGLSCTYQPNEKNQSVKLIKDNKALQENEPGRNWTKIEIPFGKSADEVSFDNQGHTAIAGKEVLFFNDGRVWQEIKGGNGNILYTTTGETNYRNSREVNKNSSVEIDNLCSVESMTFGSSNRLYIYSMCEHHTELWSVPILNLSEPWYVRSFGPSIEQYNKSDNPDYYTPYNHLVVVGKRVLIDAVLPGGISLLSTNDNGATWYPFWQKNITTRIIGLDFFNEKDGLMLLADGKILKSEDGGEKWNNFSMLPQNAVGKISSLDFANSSNGYAVGESGLVLITVDGGKTWRQQVSNTEKSLYKVKAANEKKIWIVGEKGTVLETEDGGEHWKNVELNITDEPFTDIYNISVNEGKAWIIKGNFIYQSP